MGIMNRRNAVLGWTVWKVGKRVAKKKAKGALPGSSGESKRSNKPKILGGLAAAGGALMFWRKKRDGTPPSKD